MSDNDAIEDRGMLDLYRTVARERSVPARDAAILRFARTRARRISLFRHFVVPIAAAAMVLIVLGAWRLHREQTQDGPKVHAHYAVTVTGYLLSLQVGAAAPSRTRVTQYLMDLQPDHVAVASGDGLSYPLH